MTIQSLYHRSLASTLACALLLLGAPGCRRSEAAPAPPPASKSTPSPQDRMASLDRRQEVPLIPMMAQHQKENMRDHLVVVQEILQALAARNFAAVEKAAARIGFTPQAQQMCTHMGAGAAGFTDMGMTFHHTADSVIKAAQSKNLDATLTALSDTLSTCTSCHALYRQEIVSEGEWQRLTGMRTPKGSPAGH